MQIFFVFLGMISWIFAADVNHNQERIQQIIGKLNRYDQRFRDRADQQRDVAFNLRYVLENGGRYKNMPHRDFMLRRIDALRLKHESTYNVVHQRQSLLQAFTGSIFADSLLGARALAHVGEFFVGGGTGFVSYLSTVWIWLGWSFTKNAAFGVDWGSAVGIPVFSTMGAIAAGTASLISTPVTLPARLLWQKKRQPNLPMLLDKMTRAHRQIRAIHADSPVLHQLEERYAALIHAFNAVQVEQRWESEMRVPVA